MYNVRASALRFRGTIEVTITGQLADSCVKADIDDFYPGGNVVYVRDPGTAQIFIKEWREENSAFCTFGLVPWVDHVRIPDPEHKTLHVYINRSLQLEVPIIDLPEPKKSERIERISLTGETSILPGGDYIVIALLDMIGGKHHGCGIIPEQGIYPQIFKEVFGPATYTQCVAYVKKRCDDPIIIPPRADDAEMKTLSAAEYSTAATSGDDLITPGGPGVSPWPGPNPWPGPWPNPPFPYPPYPSPPWPPYPWPPFPPTPPIPPMPGPGLDPVPNVGWATLGASSGDAEKYVEHLIATAEINKALAERVMAAVPQGSPFGVCLDGIRKATIHVLRVSDNPWDQTQNSGAFTEGPWQGAINMAVDTIVETYPKLPASQDDKDDYAEETFGKTFFDSARALSTHVKKAYGA